MCTCVDTILVAFLVALIHTHMQNEVYIKTFMMLNKNGNLCVLLFLALMRSGLDFIQFFWNE